MTNARLLHATFSLLSGLWLLPLLVIALVSTYHLGYVPQYGDPAGADSMGLAGFQPTLLVLFACGLFALPFWLGLSYNLRIHYRAGFAANIWWNAPAVASILVLLLIHFDCCGPFEWIMD